ncbi:hypothetical protein BCUE_0616 [Candidatus Kinetoplastibacterium blastocrithidii TCC012E]|uniref:Uncharacterized protein n=1 Tax=Candidatus Kinetoplastidibacterium blastocrithidiae TCC012E TaxID=1208922 RepID=M1M0J7_9PROT|nr:Mth938-like domain-containing protein [Candidatus Kinetoplastibacterium blastocrithidii]AFZ83674.1 hypothetical protein CKBE_00485 [Candidatus Kinetoplastibacterium blastocrithidii (ex Strigomonas culicis)]AGF49796.1 hypothetical protein BCUE_0616 [Candidatus Kinetoplastibacterium blastocrithidii TCC012E]
MKLYSEDYTSNNVINSYKEGSIKINGILYTDNVLFSNNSKILKLDMINIQDTDGMMLLEIFKSFQNQEESQKHIEFILIGIGNKSVSRDHYINKNRSNINIGIEIMKTQSAVYTYNALLMQDKQVLIALIIRD